MLEWLNLKSKVRRNDESFAPTQKGKLLGILSELKNLLEDSSNVVILISHFVETFTPLQDLLEQHAVEYNVVTSKTDPRWLRSLKTNPVRVHLAIAEMLRPLPPDKVDAHWQSPIRLLIAERHPRLSHDDQVREFSESLPGKVQLGYFLSFEDAVVRRFVDQRALKIIELFGVGEIELISSKMISKRLDHSLKHSQPRFVSDLPADSAQEWLELNAPREF